VSAKTRHIAVPDSWPGSGICRIVQEYQKSCVSGSKIQRFSGSPINVKNRDLIPFIRAFRRKQFTRNAARTVSKNVSKGVVTVLAQVMRV
jgi:hypothetical protein